MQGLVRPIHPFPARMAPDIAFDALKGAAPGMTVLDPMAGSGTVLRVASDLGHSALGFDVDPLAVLMAKVWTNPIDTNTLREKAREVVARTRGLSPQNVRLPWIDEDEETGRYVSYWFADAQQSDLRRLVFALKGEPDCSISEAMWVALSRIIITKDSGASLARDVSHSRPHKVRTTSDYDVLAGFVRSAEYVARSLEEHPPRGCVSVRLGDARKLGLRESSVDLVITSPPYLNAIDYLRGHRMSLVWMGYRLRDLREIRSRAVGCERAVSKGEQRPCAGVLDSKEFDRLPNRTRSMIHRYALELMDIVREAARVLRPGGRLILVVGDTYIRGVLVRNSALASWAAELAALKPEGSRTRDLMARRRYLPPPSRCSGSALSNRIGTETILTFRKVLTGEPAHPPGATGP